MARPDRGGQPLDVEGYPYDPNLSARGLQGLDRLRAIADRKLAEYLFQLHALAERNSDAPQERRDRAGCDGAALHRLAQRALAGEFGTEARELADYLLVDDVGSVREDEPTLRLFARSLRRLRGAW